MFSQHQINSCSQMKFCKCSNRFVIIFIADSVSSSSVFSRCLYSTGNVFYRKIAAITTLWLVECFLWSMGVHKLDIYMTLLLINFAHQTDAPQRIVHARDVRRWCNVANINSRWNFEVMNVYKRVILTAQFVSSLWCRVRNEMMTASCTGYFLTIFEPLLHLLTHLDHVFFVNAKEDYWFYFFLAYFQHHTIVQNRDLLLSGLCKLPFAAWCFTAPPIPSHGDFPWLVAKKIHSVLMEKSSLWEHKLRKFLKFLYCPPQPSET